MTDSQNGWPIVPDNSTGRAKLVDLDLPGDMPHHVYVLKGDVHTVFTWLVEQYHRRVEPIKPAACWGWNVRKIEGSNTWSNHSSATAVDLDAEDNPMGSGTTKKSMTPAQIAECHQLEEESGGVLHWGGDFGRNDPMHWEMRGSAAQVKVFADKIRKEEAMTPEDRKFFTDKLNGLQNAITEVQETVDGLTKPYTFATGGGEGTKVGEAMLRHGYPKKAGDQRTATWVNLQEMAQDIEDLKAQLNTPTPPTV